MARHVPAARTTPPSGNTTTQRLAGTIARIVASRGFCFIKDTTGQDYFCHMSALQGVEFARLQMGDKVQFDAAATDKGPRAENVTLL